MTGIIEFLRDLSGAPSFYIAIGTVAIGYVLKRIPNTSIQKIIGNAGYALGVSMTLGLGKTFKWTAPFWNKIIEPYFIDLLDNIA